MPDLTLGPYTVGIDNVSPETTLSPGAVRDAVNVDFDRSGGITTRPGRTSILSSTGLHSLWTSAVGVSFCVRAGYLCLADVVNGALSTTNLYQLARDLPVSLDDLNDGIAFCTIDECGWIDASGNVSKLGVENPGGFTASVYSSPPAPIAGVSADPSRYGVAISYMAGNEESALSAPQFVSAMAGSALRLTLPTPLEAKVTAVRVYLTPANGDRFFRASDAPRGASPWIVSTAATLGRRADNQFLTRITWGSIVRYWRGRLLLAQGSTLRISESMRYGLTHRTRGFVQFPGNIVMIEPVLNGIFVGIEDDGIYHLAGSGPGEFELRRTGGQPMIPGASGRISAGALGDLGEQLGARGETYAVWLARNGFVLGSSEGRIIELHRNRIRLPREQWTGAGNMVVNNRQVIAVVN